MGSHKSIRGCKHKARGIEHLKHVLAGMLFVVDLTAVCTVCYCLQGAGHPDLLDEEMLA